MFTVRVHNINCVCATRTLWHHSSTRHASSQPLVAGLQRVSCLNPPASSCPQTTHPPVQALTIQCVACRRQDVIRSSSSDWCPLRQAETTVTPGWEQDVNFVMTSSIPIDTRQRGTSEHTCSVIIIRKRSTKLRQQQRYQKLKATQWWLPKVTNVSDNLQVLVPVTFLPRVTVCRHSETLRATSLTATISYVCYNLKQKHLQNWVNCTRFNKFAT